MQEEFLCVNHTDLHILYCCCDSLLSCVTRRGFANQCTSTTCWLRPYREEVSDVSVCFHGWINRHVQPCFFSIQNFQTWNPSATQSWTLLCLVSYVCNPVPDVSSCISGFNSMCSAVFTDDFICSQCWLEVRSTWHWSTARAWWSSWMYPWTLNVICQVISVLSIYGLGACYEASSEPG